MIPTCPIDDRRSYAELKSRLSIQRIAGLEEEARLANIMFYEAVSILEYGVNIFANLGLWILFVLHYLVLCYLTMCTRAQAKNIGQEMQQ